MNTVDIEVLLKTNKTYGKIYITKSALRMRLNSKFSSRKKIFGPKHVAVQLLLVPREFIFVVCAIFADQNFWLKNDKMLWPGGEIECNQGKIR